jgi:hypothetical protein
MLNEGKWEQRLLGEDPMVVDVGKGYNITLWVESCEALAIQNRDNGFSG